MNEDLPNLPMKFNSTFLQDQGCDSWKETLNICLETNYSYLLFWLAMKQVLQSPTVPIHAGRSKILDKLKHSL